MDIVCDYKLLDIKDGVIKIEAKGKMDINLAQMMEQMTKKTEEMGFEYEMVGNFNASYELNAADGWINNMVQNMSFAGFMKMKLPEGTSLDTIGMVGAKMDEKGKVTIPMDVKLVQTMSRKE